jgi:hypothetical protein
MNTKAAWRTLGIAVATFMTVLLLAGSHAQAAEATLLARIKAKDPLHPVLTLQNSSETDCQVVESATGTVAITEVRQDGKTIEPLALGSSPSDSLELQLPKQLKTLKPGQKLDIPLDVYPFGKDHSLEAVTWSPDTGAFRTIYKIQPNKPLQIALTYDVPLAGTEGAPICGLAHASTIGDKSALRQPITFSLIAAALIALLVWIIKNRRRLKALLPLFVLLGLIGVMWHAPSARADYIVPPEIQRDFDYCMGIFRENRDITGPVLDAMDAAGTVEIIHVTTDGPGSNDSSGSRDLSYYRVYWNPVTVYRHYDGVNSEGCSALFHEMYHNYEISQGTLDDGQCGTSGIPTREVNATRAENRLRDRIGLPLRTTYGANTLPEGDCAPPPEPDSCTSGTCADTNGDPHLKTFDGLRYDFQAVGEFVAATDKSGDYEVQVRQTPWPGARDVSLNTAVAMKVGKDKVELRMLGRKLRLWVNGKEQAFKNTPLPGGGSITPANPQQVAVVWPDGSTATIRTVGTYGLDVILDPAAAKAGKLQGLFGNFDGNDQNDLKINSTNTVIKEEYGNLYPKFADSWRIDAKASLFIYDKGTDTRTYTDRSFPDKPTTATQLPNRAAAEQICRRVGATEQTILQNCILDVALTGRPEFARSATITQAALTGTTYGTDKPIPLTPDGNGKTALIGKPGEVATFTFAGQAGQRVFVNVPFTTLPGQCGGLDLKGPDGQGLNTGCIIDDRGYIDTTILPATGAYTITVDPAEQSTGRINVKVIVASEHTAALTINGPPASLTLANGDSAVWRFSGNAGQRVVVDISNSTLGQCGGIALRAPDGSGLGTGCVTDGNGTINSEGTVLPASGEYTIVIDPARWTTAQATVRVRTL